MLSKIIAILWDFWRGILLVEAVINIYFKRQDCSIKIFDELQLEWYIQRETFKACNLNKAEHKAFWFHCFPATAVFQHMPPTLSGSYNKWLKDFKEQQQQQK